MTPNSRGPRHRAPATSNITDAKDTSEGRSRPVLVIRIPLEAYPRASWEVETYEDEQRMILWLQRSDTLPMLASWLEGIAAWVEEEAA